MTPEVPTGRKAPPARLVGYVLFADAAKEDLRAIGDTSVLAEILHIANEELRLPVSATPIEGYLTDYPGIAFRRCIWRRNLHKYTSFDLDDDIDDFRHQACDYTMLYRAVTADERIEQRLTTPGLVVISVVANRRLAPAVIDRLGTR